MTYAEAITEARAAFEAGDYALSNFNLFIAAGMAKGEEVETIRKMISNNDHYAKAA